MPFLPTSGLASGSARPWQVSEFLRASHEPRPAPPQPQARVTRCRSAKPGPRGDVSTGKGDGVTGSRRKKWSSWSRTRCPTGRRPLGFYLPSKRAPRQGGAPPQCQRHPAPHSRDLRGLGGGSSQLAQFDPHALVVALLESLEFSRSPATASQTLATNANLFHLIRTNTTGQLPLAFAPACSRFHQEHSSRYHRR